MTPALMEEKVEKFREMVGSTERVGVSEFARSKAWRDRLPDSGCFEVVDRGGLVGYLIAPEYAEALTLRIGELEEQLERAQIAAIFDARSGYTDVRTGDDLAAEALRLLDERHDELMEIAHGD